MVKIKLVIIEEGSNFEFLFLLSFERSRKWPPAFLAHPVQTAAPETKHQHRKSKQEHKREKNETKVNTFHFSSINNEPEQSKFYKTKRKTEQSVW